MLHLTDDPQVNALILDLATEGEMYGEDWEDYKAHTDSIPPLTEEELDEMYEDCPF